MPMLSVVMPVHNGGDLLTAAVDSVLGQTFADFELIAVDDRSTDGSRRALEEYALRDHRVRVVSSAAPGFVGAVMTGIRLAAAPWIARMDADDVSSPERFERQMKFIESHPDVDVVGTAVQVIDPVGSPISVIRYPLDDALIKMTLRAATAFAHGSVVMRRDVLLAVGGYDTAFFPAEDYDLWCRLASGGATLANLDDPLYLYRLSEAGVSRVMSEHQAATATAIGDRYAATIGQNLPSLVDALRAVRTTWRQVEDRDASSRSLRRISSSCLHAARRWRADGFGPTASCLAVAAVAEAAFQMSRRREG